jgi:transglutaminase-like putative cysteine protease
MERNWYSVPKGLLRTSFVLFALACSPSAMASIPDWVRTAARSEVAAYPDDTNAVVLFSEEIASVAPNGRVKTVFRRVYKILRSQGQRDYGSAVVYSSSETRLTYLKAWSITAQGTEFEVKEKDAVETSIVGDEIYADIHYKILDIPAAAPGNVIAYEYEQIGHPRVFQAIWSFQGEAPVRFARYVLELPKGWQFDTFWSNHPQVQPVAGENRWIWQVENVPGLVKEDSMPSWRAVAAWLGITYHPERSSGSASSTWHDVGTWYADLAAGRRDSTPEIRKQVAELAASAPTSRDKLNALAGFVQNQIRYVAIEIGIGGYQPHPAAAILGNRYGDCKDKATLLSAMLHEIGIDSYYVLINADRGVVAPEFPSPLGFNHVILAIQLPDDMSEDNFPSAIHNKTLGRLLFFDPTDDLTQLGYLPPTLQANYGLLVAPAGGELVQLPLLLPSANRMLRAAQLSLSPSGTLSGKVREILSGPLANSRRARLRTIPDSERSRNLEEFLSSFLVNFRLGGNVVDGMQNQSASLIVDYAFLADHYAQVSGNLMFFPPRVLGNKGSDVLEKEPRKYPVTFPCRSSETDMFDIILPSGFQVDELPPATRIESPFAEYTSKIEMSGNILHYSRTIQIKAVDVPVQQLDELRQFYRKIALDQRSTAILKRTDSTSPTGDGRVAHQ